MKFYFVKTIFLATFCSIFLPSLFGATKKDFYTAQVELWISSLRSPQTKKIFQKYKKETHQLIQKLLKSPYKEKQKITVELKKGVEISFTLNKTQKKILDFLKAQQGIKKEEDQEEDEDDQEEESFQQGKKAASYEPYKSACHPEYLLPSSSEELPTKSPEVPPKREILKNKTERESLFSITMGISTLLLVGCMLKLHQGYAPFKITQEGE